MKRVVVIGAGVIGLSTALNILDQVPDVQVKVIADHFNEDITSYGSGGIFLPTITSENKIEDLIKWRTDSWEFTRKLVSGPEAGVSGAVLSNGYIVSEDEFHFPDERLTECTFSFRKLSENEFRKMNFPEHLKHGYHVSTVILDQTKYLKWLTKRIASKGGMFEQKKVASLQEFVGQCDLVVNCSGLGSRQLVGDSQVRPLRGQLVKVRAPWIKYSLYNPETLTQIIPGEQLISLGSVKQLDNGDLEPDLADTATILEKCLKIAPALKSAEIDHVWVGLRPYRDTIRVEKEQYNFENGKIQVVHNYGHGSNGIALSWGTSLHATELVKDSLNVNKEHKHMTDVAQKGTLGHF